MEYLGWGTADAARRRLGFDANEEQGRGEIIMRFHREPYPWRIADALVALEYRYIAAALITAGPERRATGRGPRYLPYMSVGPRLALFGALDDQPMRSTLAAFEDLLAPADRIRVPVVLEVASFDLKITGVPKIMKLLLQVCTPGGRKELADDREHKRVQQEQQRKLDADDAQTRKTHNMLKRAEYYEEMVSIFERTLGRQLSEHDKIRYAEWMVRGGDALEGSQILAVSSNIAEPPPALLPPTPADTERPEGPVEVIEVSDEDNDQPGSQAAG